MTSTPRIVLASRSPRRLELLQHLVPADRIDVITPPSAEEAGFDDIQTWVALDRRLIDIARTKNDAVARQLEDSASSYILSADTVIVAGESDQPPIVLGQPPTENWQAAVRDWFVNHLLGKDHQALTAVVLRTPDGNITADVVATTVSFRTADPAEVDWYVSTGEPQGKAGGYAIQGAGSVFVSAVRGSLSNVIGLPLEIVHERLRETGFHDRESD